MNKTLKAFADSTPYPKLTRAVVRQLGGWDEDTQQNLRDIAKYGVAGGFYGFIYYADTVKFFQKNRAVIMGCLLDLADDVGESPYKMMTHWSCLKGYSKFVIASGINNADSEYADQVRNALAWFAAEEVARWYVDMEEQDAA